MTKFQREPDFYKRLITLALPIVLQNVINNTLSLVDTFMVMGLGENELAAVTLGNNVFFTVILITFGVQSGSSILISQYWGKGDTKTINRILGMGLMASGAFTGLFCLIVTLFPRFVMSLTTDDQAIIAIGMEFIPMIAPAFILNSLSMMYCTTQRCMENPRIGLMILLMSTSVNTLLNYVLIYGNFGAPALGVKGCAIALLVARSLEFIVVSIYALRSTKFILRFKYMLRPGKVIFRDFMRYAMPVVGNEALWGFGFTLYPVIVGHMTNAAGSVAAFSIAMSIDRIMAALFLGTGSAVAVLLGKSLGQGKAGDEIHAYAKQLLKITCIVGICAGVLLAALSTFVAKPFLFPLFEDMSPETMETTWLLLLILSANMVFRSANFTIIVGILRGGGDIMIAVFLDLVFMYGIGIPVAYFFGLQLEMGVLMVAVGMLAEELTKSIGSLLRFRSRKWIRNVTKEIG